MMILPAYISTFGRTPNSTKQRGSVTVTTKVGTKCGRSRNFERGICIRYVSTSSLFYLSLQHKELDAFYARKRRLAEKNAKANWGREAPPPPPPFESPTDTVRGAGTQWAGRAVSIQAVGSEGQTYILSYTNIS